MKFLDLRESFVETTRNLPMGLFRTTLLHVRRHRQWALHCVRAVEELRRGTTF